MKYFFVLISCALFVFNPFGLQEYWPLIYVAPVLLYSIFENNIITKMDIENQADIELKIDKYVKLLIQFLGMLSIAASVGNFEIPFLTEIINIVKYIGDNIGAGAEAVGVLLGILITIYGMIKENFKVTKYVAKRIVTNQYRKYEE